MLIGCWQGHSQWPGLAAASAAKLRSFHFEFGASVFSSVPKSVNFCQVYRGSLYGTQWELTGWYLALWKGG